MADGGHLGKIEKSPYFSSCMTDRRAKFGKLTHFGRLERKMSARESKNRNIWVTL